MFRLISPSSAQVDALSAQFNAPDAARDDGEGRSIVSREGFLVTSEIPEGFDVGPDEFAVVEGTVDFPSVLILGQNNLVAPFIAGLDDIDFQQQPGSAIGLFDQTRNGGGSNLADVDPNDLDQVADLFVGSDILAAGPDAGLITAVDPSAEEFDAILESLEETGGLTSDGFAVAPLPLALENIENPDPNQIVLTPAGTTSDGQSVPPALFVENLQQVAVFNAALEAAGLGDVEINNLVNNVFNPLRNGDLEDFNPELAADIGVLFGGAEIVDGGNVVDAGDGLGDEAGGDDVVEDDGGDADDGGEVADGDDGNVINADGGVQFVRFAADAEQLSVIREALETGDTAGISVDNFAVGAIPDSLNDPSSASEVLLVEGGVDAQGNDVPPSLLIDPAALARQAPFRIALEEAFPDDGETRNLLQRQFDQIRNDNLQEFEVGDDIDDVTAIFDGVDLEAIGEIDVADDGQDEDVNVDGDDNEAGDDGADDVDVEVAAGDGIVLEGDQGADVLVGTDGDDVINGLTGADTIDGFGGNDQIDAGGGEDVVRAGDGDDIIIGGGGQDELFGDGGNDVITGGIGDDQLFGGDGDDVLNGELVNDTITTGAGADTVIFDADGGNDRITDFEAGVDRLEINGFGDNPDFDVASRGDDTVLRINGNDRIVLEDFAADEFNEDDVTFDGQAVA